MINVIKTILVIAKNYTQAEYYMGNFDRRKWAYVDSIDRLRGVTNIVLFLVGDWDESPLFKDNELETICHLTNASVFINNVTPLRQAPAAPRT